MRLQSAAYLQARTEETGKNYTGGRYLVRMNKNTGEPEVMHLAVRFGGDLQGFLAALALYRRVLEDNGRRSPMLKARKKPRAVQKVVAGQTGGKPVAAQHPFTVQFCHTRRGLADDADKSAPDGFRPSRNGQGI